MPAGSDVTVLETRLFFGGLYQQLALTRRA